MVKRTQISRGLLPTNCLSVIDHFVGLALKRLIAFSVKTMVLINLYTYFHDETKRHYENTQQNA